MSGYGGIQENNDSQYCSSCYQVIQTALKAVPVVREKDFLYTKDITVAELVALEPKEFKPGQIRRVVSNLFDLVDPSNKNHTGAVTVGGKSYLYSWWDNQGIDEGEVRLEVEVDAKTGEVVGPWDLKTHWESWPTFYVPEKTPPLTQETVINPCPMKKPNCAVFHISQTDFKPLIKTYTPIGKSKFTSESLPEGFLPVYDRRQECKDQLSTIDKQYVITNNGDIEKLSPEERYERDVAFYTTYEKYRTGCSEEEARQIAITHMETLKGKK